MRRCISCGIVALCISHNAAQQAEPSGCWYGTWSTLRSACCGPPVDPSCFNLQFSEDRCCRKQPEASSKEARGNCLPLQSEEVQMLLHLSAGLETPRLSTGSQAGVCSAAGWKALYTVLRVGPVELIPQTPTALAMAVAPTSGSAAHGQAPAIKVLQTPMRPLLLCVPPRCSDDPSSAEELVAYAAEQTLPVSLRPGRLLHPVLLLTEPWDRIAQHAKEGDEERVDRAIDGGWASVPCHSGACATLLPGVQEDGRAELRFPGRALVVIDIGAHARTEFLRWLEADVEHRRWVVAIEPDPALAAQHPEHPRLALFEAAVGDPGRIGVSTLHRSKSGQCNSLLPLPASLPDNLRDLSGVTNCLTPAEAGNVEVRVLALSSLLRALPSGQEVMLLKIDAQGSDLAVILSAGEDLRRVRKLQVEVVDLARGHAWMPYGPSQPTKEDIVRALTARGFALDACRPNVPELREENCLFVRADLLEEPPNEFVSGAIRWDRP